MVRRSDVQIETFVDGAGPALVILPSPGRDGGEGYNDTASRPVRANRKVLGPQPRNIAGSGGPMTGVTLHDLADDVAAVIRELGDGSALLPGHAFGYASARMLAADRPELVREIMLAASQASEGPCDVAGTPFTLGRLDEPETGRRAVPRKAFFAPGHDAGPWPAGWYPETPKMHHEAAKVVPLSAHRACGRAPMLGMFGALDPFKPEACWPEACRHEPSDQLGSRITPVRAGDAAHALVPEQPDRVAEAVLSWPSRRRDAAAKPRDRA